MITIVFALVVIIMMLFPKTPFAQWLYFHIVINPINVIQSLERKHFIYLFVGLFFVQSYAAVMPLEIATALAWEASIYFDAMITVWTASALARSKASWAAMKEKSRFVVSFIFGKQSLARRKRMQTKPATKKPTNDNDDPRIWLAVA